MSRFLHSIDRFIDLGIISLLVFPPLAFGAVEPWARSAGQVLVALTATAWILRLIWAPPRLSSRSRSGAILGGRVSLSGLERPALLLAGLVLLQLVPLPPAIVAGISPATDELYTAALPGYGSSASGSFESLPGWLEDRAQPEAGGVPVFPMRPSASEEAMPQEWFDVAYSRWRPLSLTPAHTRRTLAVFLAHLVFFLVVFNQLERKGTLRRYAVVVTAMVGLLSLIGIFQSLTSDNKLYWWRGAGRTASFGPFVNANNFAGWMEMALPVAAGLTIVLWRRKGRRESRAPAGTLLFGFITVVGLTSFALAKSRGGFLALSGSLAIVLVVMALARRVSPRVVALALIPVVLAFAMAVWIDGSALRDRYGTIGEFSEQNSFRARLEFTRLTLAMAADFPVLGTGLGTFREAYYLYTPGTANRELAHAHNDYAQLAAESGIPGVLAMIWALTLLVKRGLIGALVRRDRQKRWFAWSAAVAVLALLLHSFASFNLQIYSNSLLFVFLCAVLMRCHADSKTGRSRSRA